MTSRFTKALVISALGAVGALVWSACSSSSDGHYYCDTSGCYSCDAYGCSDVTTPSHPACSATVACASGMICTTTGCDVTCKTDSSCPKGETCQTGLCSAPGTAPGTPIEGVDAGSDGSTVTPSDGGPPSAPCGTGPACTGTNVCVLGACTAPQNACQFTSECATGKVCADGACLSSCDASTPCGSGFTCTKNVCEPNGTGAGDGGTTTPTTCATDSECGAGKYCNNTACVVDTRPQPNCSNDSECGGTTGTPKKCLAGYCKYTCTSDQYCRTIDSRIGYCASDSVCRSSTEATAQCTGPGTCPLAGQDCIDNQCK